MVKFSRVAFLTELATSASGQARGRFMADTKEIEVTLKKSDKAKAAGLIINHNGVRFGGRQTTELEIGGSKPRFTLFVHGLGGSAQVTIKQGQKVLVDETCTVAEDDPDGNEFLKGWFSL